MNNIYQKGSVLLGLLIAVVVAGGVYVAISSNMDTEPTPDNNTEDALRYMTSPGFVTQEAYQEFEANRLICVGESVPEEVDPLIADVPTYAYCYGELIPVSEYDDGGEIDHTIPRGELTTINVPLITTLDDYDIGPSYCGNIKFHPVQIDETSAVLTAVYQQLFEIPKYPFGGEEYYNEVASRANSSIGTTLDFVNVEIVDGVADLYLEGTVLGGHCDVIAFNQQIQQAAFQFPSVDTLRVFVNGEIFDSCDISNANPEESGCDENPKPWIVENPNQ
jgi:hypothetical protein